MINMFNCVRKDIHPAFWTISLANESNFQDCFLCMLNQLSNGSVTSVQKQILLKLMLSSLEDGSIIDALRQNLKVTWQVIDTCGELHSDEPLQDLVVPVCVMAIDKLQEDDGFFYLLETFKAGIRTLNENTILFSMNVVSSLQPLSSIYEDVLIASYGDTILTPLLDKVEFMEENMILSLIHLLIPVVKHNKMESSSRVTGQLIPLLVTWLDNSQSLDMKRSVLKILKEVLQHREYVHSLLSFERSTCNVDGTDALSQTKATQDCRFLMGLKRIMTCKESVLTICCVNCLTQILGHVNDSEHLRQIMASDLPEFIFESLHTKDTMQLETTFCCLQALVNRDEFFQGCHAVYGIDATLNAVKESIDSQRLILADSGLHLLWCLLDRQPENMPLLLNCSWASCHQLLLKALQHENNTIFVASLQVTSAFLRPQHQQSPIDIQAILSLVCIVSSKSQSFLKKEELEQPNSFVTANRNSIQPHCLLLDSLMDVIIHITCLFQSDTILPGNDKQQICELKNVVQSFATNVVVSEKYITFLRGPGAVKKYLQFVNAYLFIQFYDTENEERSQFQSQDCFPYLLTKGLPWLILRAVSPHRCPALEEQASSLVIFILINCLKSLPTALWLDPDVLILGLTQLEWSEKGLNIENIPTHREALLVELVLLYFSYHHNYRPWSFDNLCYFLHQVFKHFPSLCSWHPIVLKSIVYFFAMSEDPLGNDSTQIEQNYESAVLAEMEKTSLELWYTDCVEVLRWTLSSKRRRDSIGKKTVEYWLHQLTLVNTPEEEMEMILCYLKVKGCLPFFQYIIDLLGSNTVGKTAKTILLIALQNDVTASIGIEMLKWIHEKLELALSQTTSIDVTAVDNILPVLYLIIEGEPKESLTCLHSVKLVCHFAKYLTQQEETSKLKTSLKYLSALVTQLTPQESKIVIPPLMQNSKFISLLSFELSNTESPIHSYVLILCAWLSKHGNEYQASSPLTITINLLLSSLASSRLADIGAILQLLQSALISAENGHKSSGAVIFVRSHQAFFSCQHIFKELEVHQIFCYVQQYMVQGNMAVKELAFNILQMILTMDFPFARQFKHNPWNSFLLETVLTMKTHSSLSCSELQLCSMLISSEDAWTATSANCFLLALINTDLDAIDVTVAKKLISQLKQWTDLVDPILLDETEKCLQGLCMVK